MNKTQKEVSEFIDVISEKELPKGISYGICAPFVYLTLLKEELKGTRIGIGAQNVHWEKFGAYTGEVSAEMLSLLGVQYVIVGHSERRMYFSETNERINQKLQAVIDTDLHPILCVGETLEDRKDNKTSSIIKSQVDKALDNISSKEITRIIIAYEPIWAIGSGESASAEDAQKVIGFIRRILRGRYGEEIANRIRIQYGGSVNANNIHQFMEKADIDGVLVGGASLDPLSFIDMICRVGE